MDIYHEERQVFYRFYPLGKTLWAS